MCFSWMPLSTAWRTISEATWFTAPPLVTQPLSRMRPISPVFAWIQPTRNPGARIFEKVPIEITLPSSISAPIAGGTSPS